MTRISPRNAKAIRHELATALAAFAPKERHAAHDAQADVGTELTLSARTDTRWPRGGVVQANFKRLEQSLRGLEECSETVTPKSGQDRSDCGTASQLKRAVRRQRAHSLDRLTRRNLRARRWARIGRSLRAVDGVAGRGRRLDDSIARQALADRELLNRARCVRELTQAAGVLFIMNDRPDVAVLARHRSSPRRAGRADRRRCCGEVWAREA